MTIRAVIADDEPLARKKLTRLLEQERDIELVGTAADGPETVRLVSELAPDLLFLDIRMPGATGIEVLEQLEQRPHVIFTTAYDRYAVTAFELQALDYLLKPFGKERFGQALARAKEVLGGPGSRAAPRIPTLDSEGPLHRLFVRERGRIVPIAVSQIDRLEAVDDYVMVHVGGRKHLVSVRLRDFEARLDSVTFVRVHRSHMVNMDRVVALTPHDGTRLQIEMQDGTRIVASRTRSRELRKLVV